MDYMLRIFQELAKVGKNGMQVEGGKGAWGL